MLSPRLENAEPVLARPGLRQARGSDERYSTDVQGGARDPEPVTMPDSFSPSGSVYAPVGASPAGDVVRSRIGWRTHITDATLVCARRGLR